MTIGDKNHILFELIGSDLTQEVANINFYLGDRLISNESVYIPTYILSFKSFLEYLTKGHFQNIKFVGLKPDEHFKKLEKERDSNEPQFFKHLLQLDETIDQYTIFVFESYKGTNFVWSCWSEHNCNSDHQLNEIYSAYVNTTELTLILRELISELNKRLANIV